MACPTSCPGMKFINIPLTLSAQGIKIDPGVLNIATVFGLTAATYSINLSAESFKSKFCLSLPSYEKVAPKTKATSAFFAMSSS